MSSLARCCRREHMMQILDLQALSGAAALAVLSGLCLFIWKRVGYPSVPWFAAGFLASAIGLAVSVALGAANKETPPQFLTAARFVVTALFCVGLIRLTEMAPRTRMRWEQGLAATLVAGYCVGLALDFDYGSYAVVVVSVQVAMLGLYVRLAQKQPRQGYLFVAAALALFPAGLLAFYLGRVPIAFARYQSPTIYVLVTMAAMTVRLLRERTEVLNALAAKEAAQDLLKSLNMKLDERVAARTKELEEVVRYQDGFNRSVAHDLRGPVSAIASYSQLLCECLDRNDLPALHKGLPAISKQAESVVRTVNALLRLARANDIKLQLTTTVLEQVVRTALHDARLAQADKGPSDVEVTINPLPTVVADVELVKQLYTNLLSNALKFTRERPNGHVEVGCEAAADDTDTFVYYVRDNGAGFDMRRAERLFEPFVRMHGREFEGTGVGLSICKRIVTRHAGAIWVESAPGKGTTFYFTFGSPERPVTAVRRPWYAETVLPDPTGLGVTELHGGHQPPALH